jgi:hypothetical protein
MHNTTHTQPSRINWATVYSIATLATIAVCAIAHLIAIYQSTTPAQAVMPLYGVVACIAYGLVCYASRKTSLFRLLFVAGALTTFWIQ